MSRRVGVDDLGDVWILDTHGSSEELVLEMRDFETFVEHFYTVLQARDLAKALNDLADELDPR